ncbi:MAG: nuclear transport factor 2 family protein [Bacteroidota bacterium]
MRRYLFPLMVALGLSACQDTTVSTYKLQQTQQEVNLQLITQYFESFNQHKWEQMAAMYAPTADFKDPSLDIRIVKQTREETIAKYTQLNLIFPDLHDQVIQMYPSGSSHVIVEFISTGTAPDSSKFELPICTIFTIEEGKITKDFTYYDNFDEEEEE